MPTTSKPDTKEVQATKAVAPAAICSAWLDLPDREGWWWKHFGGDEAAHVIRVTAQEVESMRKWGDWRGKGIVIHYLGPIPEPALPNAGAVAPPPQMPDSTNDAPGG